MRYECVTCYNRFEASGTTYPPCGTFSHFGIRSIHSECLIPEAMKPKNIKQQRVESNRFTFTQIGLVVSLILVFFAFEWKTTLHSSGELSSNQVRPPDDQDFVIITGVKPPPPPPPPPAPVTVINPVDDTKDTGPDPLVDVGITAGTAVPVYTPPKPPDPEPIPEPEVPYKVVQKEPRFPGGDQARLQFLIDHIRYPSAAREVNIQGTVFVSFVVEKDGSITNISLLRGIGGGCDEEAMRVVGLMPRWEPGCQLNKPVRVQFTLPVKFILR